MAEQFALLEAAYPGRIDLGIGRAPGTDPVTSWTLRGGAGDAEAVAQFPAYVQQVMTFMGSEGGAVQIGGRRFDIRATPRASGRPPVWLLGSSDYSARLAAELGLPYVFAHHFAGRGTAEALELYRGAYAGDGQPATFLTANVVVGDTQEEADRRALPFQLAMAALRAGLPPRPTLTVEEAFDAPREVPDALLDAIREPWLVGTAETVAERLRALAGRFAVDEVMVQPVAGASTGDPLDRTPARESTIRELVAALG